MSCKKHKCECKHQNVRYCDNCKVVHCDNCNQEWTAKVSYNPYITYTYPSSQWTYTSSNQPTLGGVTSTSLSKCEHKD